MKNYNELLIALELEYQRDARILSELKELKKLNELIELNELNELN